MEKKLSNRVIPDRSRRSSIAVPRVNENARRIHPLTNIFHPTKPTTRPFVPDQLTVVQAQTPAPLPRAAPCRLRLCKRSGR